MRLETAERYVELENILDRLDSLLDDAKDVEAMDVAGAIESAMDETRAAMEEIQEETFAQWEREEREMRLEYERAVL